MKVVRYHIIPKRFMNSTWTKRKKKQKWFLSDYNRNIQFSLEHSQKYLNSSSFLLCETTNELCKNITDLSDNHDDDFLFTLSEDYNR